MTGLVHQCDLKLPALHWPPCPACLHWRRGSTTPCQAAAVGLELSQCIAPQGARLDYALCTPGLLGRVVSCEIISTPPKWSDHAALLLGGATELLASEHHSMLVIHSLPSSDSYDSQRADECQPPAHCPQSRVDPAECCAVVARYQQLPLLACSSSQLRM